MLRERGTARRPGELKSAGDYVTAESRLRRSLELVPDRVSVLTNLAGVLVYQGRLEIAGVSARIPTGEWFTLQVNETWGRATAPEIAARFRKALG